MVWRDIVAINFDTRYTFSSYFSRRIFLWEIIIILALNSKKHKFDNINDMINKMSISGNVIRILVYDSKEHHKLTINDIDNLKHQCTCIHFVYSTVELKNTFFITYFIIMKLLKKVHTNKSSVMNNSFENKFHKEQINMFSNMSTNYKIRLYLKIRPVVLIT